MKIYQNLWEIQWIVIPTLLFTDFALKNQATENAFQNFEKQQKRDNVATPQGGELSQRTESKTSPYVYCQVLVNVQSLYFVLY